MAAAETIPVIDLGPYLAGESGALDRTAQALRFALTEIGAKRNHLATVLLFEPAENDRGIQPARVGEHNLFDAHLLLLGTAASRLFS